MQAQADPAGELDLAKVIGSCGYCGKRFIRYRASQQYHRASCRQLAYLRRKREGRKLGN